MLFTFQLTWLPHNAYHLKRTPLRIKACVFLYAYNTVEAILYMPAFQQGLSMAMNIPSL